MPHIIVEYTDNLQNANIPQLLKKMNHCLITEGDLFPIGGIRSRANCLKDYVVADGSEPDDAFVHVTLKIGSGRPSEVLESACDRLFQVIEEHFAEIFQSRYLALSMEVYEFPKATYKKNNIHQRFK